MVFMCGPLRAGSLVLKALSAIGSRNLTHASMQGSKGMDSDEEPLPSSIHAEAAVAECFQALARGAVFDECTHMSATVCRIYSVNTNGAEGETTLPLASQVCRAGRCQAEPR